MVPGTPGSWSPSLSVDAGPQSSPIGRAGIQNNLQVQAVAAPGALIFSQNRDCAYQEIDSAFLKAHLSHKTLVDALSLFNNFKLISPPWQHLGDKHPLSLFLRKVCEKPYVSRPGLTILQGTDQSQGKGQVISNINACLAVQATIKSTLGPYGGDLLLVDGNGKQTITNDGATVMKVG